MKNGRFILVYLILVLVQILLCNFFGLSRYFLISTLPVLIVMLPLGTGSITAMLIAFATGFAVDFFSNGMLGITSLALVPVAFSRRFFISLIFGDEQASRDDEISFSRFGLPKIALAVLLACALFFALFIWVDSAGTVGFWPAALRCLLSVLVSTPLCVFVARLLRPE